jgi:hypothetical protein
MKTKFNTIIKTVIFTLITLAYSGLSAQTYYTPGQVYTFRNKIDDTHTLQANVLFDAAGNATVTKTTVNTQESDRNYSAIFASHDKIEFTENSSIKLVGSTNEFWAIEFTNEVDNASPVGGGTLTASCPCKKGKANCTVSRIKAGTGYNIWCDTGLECDVCGEMQFSRPTGETTATILVIQAKSIIFN